MESALSCRETEAEILVHRLEEREKSGVWWAEGFSGIISGLQRTAKVPGLFGEQSECHIAWEMAELQKGNW